MSLSIQSLYASHGRKPVLTNVTAQLEPGRITALIGPNGTGKSTLLKAVSGLMPATGEVTLNGEVLHAPRRREIFSYMPQDSGAQSSISVFEVVLLGRMRSLGLSVPQELQDEVEATLARFGIAHLAARALDQISGGQRQMVFLAQAMFRRPEVLLLDEPTAALDMRHQLVVLETVKETVQSRNMIAVIALHDLNLVAQFADHVICLSDGRLNGEGTCAEVLTPERLAAIYGVHAEVSTNDRGDLRIRPIRPV